MKYVTLDFETYYDKDYSLKKLTYEKYIADERFKVHCVGIKMDGGTTYYYFGSDIEEAIDLFIDSDTMIIAHNALFDGAILEWYYDKHPKGYYCTQAMSRALWNQRPATLDQLAKSCFPNDKTKRKGKELAQFKGRFELTTEEKTTLGTYCANDVELTFQCFAEMFKWFPEDELDVLSLTVQMFTKRPLVLDRLRVETYLEGMAAQRQEVVRRSGLPSSVFASNEKFAQWILAQGIPFEKVASPTKAKPHNTKWPLGKDALEFLDLQRNYPQFKHIWDARIAVKSTAERTRAVRLLEHSETCPTNPEGNIAVPLNYGQAHTLRWGGTNKVNFQNFKRGSELRRALCAPKDHVIIVADAANIEPRTNAWFADDLVMIHQFATKQDLYNDFGSDIYARRIDRKGADEIEGFIAKVCVLGLGFQMGAKRLQHTLAKGALGGPQVFLSLEQCKHIVALFRDKYRGIRKGWDRCSQFIHHMAEGDKGIDYKGLRFEHHRILMPDGLYMNYPGLVAIPNENGGHDYEYFNGKHMTKLYGGKLTENIVQRLARAIHKTHMLKYQAEIETLSSSSRVALTSHDEIVSVVPKRAADECQELLLSIMRTPPAWCNDGSMIIDAEATYAEFYAK